RGRRDGPERVARLPVDGDAALQRPLHLGIPHAVVDPGSPAVTGRREAFVADAVRDALAAAVDEGALPPESGEGGGAGPECHGVTSWGRGAFRGAPVSAFV